MTHVTCRLTAKNRDRLWNPTLGNSQIPLHGHGHGPDTDKDTDFFAAKLRWVRAGPFGSVSVSV